MQYSDTKLTGEIRAPGRTIPIDVDLDEPVVAGGAGRDAVIAGLPLAVGYRATIRTFDLNMGRARPMLLEVTGTETVESAGARSERRPYRKPVPELRGQIKPSLLGSPPDPPALW